MQVDFTAFKNRWTLGLERVTTIERTRFKVVWHIPRFSYFLHLYINMTPNGAHLTSYGGPLAVPSSRSEVICKNVKNLSKYWSCYLNFFSIRHSMSWRYCLHMSFLVKLEVEITNTKKYSYPFFPKFPKSFYGRSSCYAMI